MTVQEINAIKGLTKSVDSLVAELKKMNRSGGSNKPADPIVMPDAGEPQSEQPDATKLPAYAPSHSTIPLDERTSDGFGKVTPEGIDIHLPENLYPEMTRDLIDEGGVTGFRVVIMHRNRTR